MAQALDTALVGAAARGTLTWGGFVAIGVSATLAFIGAYFGAYAKRKAEYQAEREQFREALAELKESTEAVEAIKLQLATTGSLGNELRAAVQQYTLAHFGALHSMCWVGWHVLNNGSGGSTKQYDEEVHKLLPQMSGYLSSIAALDSELYRGLHPLTMEVYRLDVALSEAVLHIRNASPESLKPLREVHAEAIEAELRHRAGIADLVSRRFAAVARHPAPVTTA
jgi:hypothetical protein